MDFAEVEDGLFALDSVDLAELALFHGSELALATLLTLLALRAVKLVSDLAVNAFLAVKRDYLCP